MSTYIRRRPDPSDRLSGNRWALLAIAFHLFVVVTRLSDALPGWQIAKVTLLLATALALHSPSRSRITMASTDVRLVIALFALSVLSLITSAWPSQTFTHITSTSLLLSLVLHLVGLLHQDSGRRRPHHLGVDDLAFEPGMGLSRRPAWRQRHEYVRPQRSRLRLQHGSLRRSREYAVRKGMATLGRPRSHRHDASRRSQNRVSSRLRHPGRGWTLRALAVSVARARPGPPLHRGHRTAGGRLCAGRLLGPHEHDILGRTVRERLRVRRRGSLRRSLDRVGGRLEASPVQSHSRRRRRGLRGRRGPLPSRRWEMGRLAQLLHPGCRRTRPAGAGGIRLVRGARVHQLSSRRASNEKTTTLAALSVAAGGPHALASRVRRGRLLSLTGVFDHAIYAARRRNRPSRRGGKGIIGRGPRSDRSSTARP